MARTGSLAFARIKAEVLALAGQLRRGRVTTHAELGRRLDVPARHVAYILATLDDDDADAVPWHRVVSDGGRITARGPRGIAQRERLAAEGVALDRAGVIDLPRRMQAFPRPPGPRRRYAS